MDEQRQINILVTLDANYIMPLRVLLHSLAMSDETSFFAVYVAHSSLTADDFTRIGEALPAHRFAVYPVAVPAELLCDAPVLRRLTKASYYRLIAPSFLPDDVDRILYLDPDITVIRSLQPLYATDLGDNYIAAAGHFDGLIRSVNLRRLRIRHNPDYVNSGVLRADFRFCAPPCAQAPARRSGHGQRVLRRTYPRHGRTEVQSGRADVPAAAQTRRDQRSMGARKHGDHSLRRQQKTVEYALQRRIGRLL